MKTILHIVAAALLVLVTPAAYAKNTSPAPRAAKPTAVAVTAKKASFWKPSTWRIFAKRKAAPAPVVAQPKLKPKPKPDSSVVRRGSGQRSSRKPSATGTVPATSPTKARPTTAVIASAAPRRANTPPTPGSASVTAATPVDVLAKPPAATPVETDRLQEQYSQGTALGRAMRGVLEDLENQSTQPTEVKTETVVARVTAFHAGDRNSAAGKTNTPGVRLRVATETQIGVAAGPAELLGSYVIIVINGKEYRYLVADVGSAVEKRTASRGTAPVIDLYAPGGQRWDSYKPVQIVQVTGAAHLLLQDVRHRDDFLRKDVFERALAMAQGS